MTPVPGAWAATPFGAAVLKVPGPRPSPAPLTSSGAEIGAQAVAGG